MRRRASSHIPVKGIPKERLLLPSSDHVDKAWGSSDRSAPVLVNLQRLYGTGRLANTGYLSILPVDQGVEHSAAASFAPNLDFFAPENIVELAIEAECNAVASTIGVLGAVARKYAHKIPFIAKINHNELLTYPNKFDQILFGSVEQAVGDGRGGGGRHGLLRQRRTRTARSSRSPRRSSTPTSSVWRPCSGPTPRNNAFKKDGVDYHTAADLTGQANHLAVTMQADIVKQKQPRRTTAATTRSTSARPAPRIYGELVADHPIDLDPLAGGRTATWAAPALINSGGESKGADDLAQAVRTAVINKRAGGTGLISGRKAFQRPHEGRRRAPPRDPGRLPL